MSGIPWWQLSWPWCETRPTASHMKARNPRRLPSGRVSPGVHEQTGDGFLRHASPADWFVA